MIKGAALSLGTAMARGHSLRATHGAGPAVPLAAFPLCCHGGHPQHPTGFAIQVMLHCMDASQKISLWVKISFAKRHHSLIPPQADWELCPGFGRYHDASSPSITTDCLFALVFGPLAPKIPFTVGLVPEPSPHAFLQQRGSWCSP